MGTLLSNEPAQIGAAATGIAPQQLTAALLGFANAALKITASRKGRKQPPRLAFDPFPTSRPINGGQAYLIAKLADGSLDKQGFVCGMIKVIGNKAWIILRDTTVGTTGISARLSWTVTPAGTPTVPKTRENHHALRRLAFALS